MYNNKRLQTIYILFSIMLCVYTICSPLFFCRLGIQKQMHLLIVLSFSIIISTFKIMRTKQISKKKCCIILTIAFISFVFSGVLFVTSHVNSLEYKIIEVDSSAITDKYTDSDLNGFLMLPFEKNMVQNNSENYQLITLHGILKNTHNYSVRYVFQSYENLSFLNGKADSWCRKKALSSKICLAPQESVHYEVTLIMNKDKRDVLLTEKTIDTYVGICFFGLLR